MIDFKIKKGDFLNLLRWSQGIAEKKGTMPILANILIEATSESPAGGLSVMATDMEIAVTARGVAEVKQGGKVVVHARHLYEIVREAPDDEVKVIGQGETGVEVFSGKARFRVIGMRPEDFPALPQVIDRDEVKMDKEELVEMIEKTFYAASTDETRYTLNSLYFTKMTHGEKVFFRLVATDGHRLSFSERVMDKESGWGKGVIVPRKGVVEMKKLLADGEGEVKVSVDEKALLFRRGGVSLVVRLIDGEFPNYEQIIPKKSDKIVSLGRDSLIGALRRAAIMVTGEGKGVKFSFSPSRLEIRANHPDLGEAVEEVDIDYKGANFQVGFNPRYFLDLLNVLEDEKVVLELKDEVSPCVVRSEFDRGFLAMVMPMRI